MVSMKTFYGRYEDILWFQSACYTLVLYC